MNGKANQIKYFFLKYYNKTPFYIYNRLILYLWIKLIFAK